MIVKILVLIIGAPLGFWFVRNRARVVETVGKMEWAERYLGNGGTYNVWLLIGTLLAVGSILYFFGLLPGV